MTLTISDLPPEVERRLKSEAARLGVDEVEYVKQLIQLGLSATDEPTQFVDQATLDLLARWDAEDATDDPAEIARRQTQWEEFRKSMNDDSLSGRPVYP